MFITPIFFLFVLFHQVTASFEFNLRPNCRDCKWYTSPTSVKGFEPGICNLYSSKIEYGNAEIVIHKYAIQCRLNSNLCGMDGSSFEKKEDNIREKRIAELKKIQDEISKIENDFNGEACEKNEIQQLEEEIQKLQTKLSKYKNSQ